MVRADQRHGAAHAVALVTSPRSGRHLAQQPGGDVEHEAPHGFGVRDERAGLDAGDGLPHVLVQVGEGLGGPLRLDAGLVLDGALEVVISEGEHAAVGVVDQDDLPRPQQALADGEGADLVVGDHAAGVADHVRLALGEAERAVDVQAGVHAGDDGDPLGGRQRERTGEGLGVAGVVGEVCVGGGHAATQPGCAPRGNGPSRVWDLRPTGGTPFRPWVRGAAVQSRHPRHSQRAAAGSPKRRSANWYPVGPMPTTTPAMNRSPSLSRRNRSPRNWSAREVAEALTSMASTRPSSNSRTRSTSTPSRSRKWNTWKSWSLHDCCFSSSLATNASNIPPIESEVRGTSCCSVVRFSRIASAESDTNAFDRPISRLVRFAVHGDSSSTRYTERNTSRYAVMEFFGISAPSAIRAFTSSPPRFAASRAITDRRRWDWPPEGSIVASRSSTRSR